MAQAQMRQLDKLKAVRNSQLSCIGRTVHCSVTAIRVVLQMVAHVSLQQ